MSNRTCEKTGIIMSAKGKWIRESSDTNEDGLLRNASGKVRSIRNNSDQREELVALVCAYGT